MEGSHGLHEAAMATRPATVFVADDNLAILQGLKRALSATGYAVETAEDGRAALRLLREASDAPDLLLLDVMMPEMSGLEVLEAMRADARLSHIPVLLITATTDDSLPERVQQDPSLELLAKPFRLDQLLARVAGHLAPGGADDAAAGLPRRDIEGIDLLPSPAGAAQRLIPADPAPLPAIG